MLSLFWLSYSPRARAVVLFAGLGLLSTLITSLVFSTNWEYLYTESFNWPLAHPWLALARIGVAFVTAFAILWLVRPGRRRWGETLLCGSCLLAYASLVAYSYNLTGVMLVIPIVLRYWYKPLATLGLSLPLIGLGMWLSPGYLFGFTQPASSLETFWQATVSLFGQSVFAFIAFELTLRREEDRAHLREALLELRRYRDLELQHATLEERTRLSRDLHDTLGHELTALRLEVQRARKVQRDPPALAESLDRALDRSAESMGSLQAAVKALRPQRLGTSLLGSIQELARAWPSTVTLALPEREPALSPAARLAAFRCVQEGLTNAQKHAPGTALSVDVVVQQLDVMVTLHNVYSPPAVGKRGGGGGLGLKGLTEQVEAAGGDLQISTEGGAFCLQATFPLLELR
ncbi:histidine kinase [Deinococcus sp. Leaf326]|uniref:sensor histidine kinase n=1 Tax=Deinococcus sp. Leaf326 TaxID=1736338 RepID=UPI0006F68389|nr:histidine kinase [Deinococcus sp. Leaf326]KQR25678.1 hypothetical protein ASF71_18505 [Deinococcus sp. Leaf326]